MKPASNPERFSHVPRHKSASSAVDADA